VGHATIFWEHQGHRVLRRGDWKLVASHSEPWELHDLAAARLEVAAELAVEHQRWSDSALACCHGSNFVIVCAEMTMFPWRSRHVLRPPQGASTRSPGRRPQGVPRRPRNRASGQP